MIVPDEENVLRALRLAMTSLRQIGRGEVKNGVAAAELAVSLVEQEYAPVIAMLDASAPEDALFVAPRMDGTFLPDKALSDLLWAAENIATEFVKSEALGWIYRCTACGETSDRPTTIVHTDHCMVGYVVEARRQVHEVMSQQHDLACDIARRVREAAHAV